VICAYNFKLGNTLSGIVGKMPFVLIDILRNFLNITLAPSVNDYALMLSGDV
jgi:hypothetical protein